jgi:hypothetical protein
MIVKLGGAISCLPVTGTPRPLLFSPLNQHGMSLILSRLLISHPSFASFQYVQNMFMLLVDAHGSDSSFSLSNFNTRHTHSWTCMRTCMWISRHTLQMPALLLQPLKLVVSLIFPFTSFLEIFWSKFFSYYFFFCMEFLWRCSCIIQVLLII